jgi:transposase
MQERRRGAARLFAAGKLSQAEIARELNISRQSVSRWFEAWRQDNPGWIRGAGRAGRRPKLDGAQLKRIRPSNALCSCAVFSVALEL